MRAIQKRLRCRGLQGETLKQKAELTTDFSDNTDMKEEKSRAIGKRGSGVELMKSTRRVNSAQWFVATTSPSFFILIRGQTCLLFVRRFVECHC